MKKKIEITVKCSTPSQLREALEEIAQTACNAHFDKYPNDLGEREDKFGRTYGFSYDALENDGTDIYGNQLEET